MSDLEELVKMSQIDVTKINSDLLGKIEKLRAITRFNDAKRRNPKASQKELCQSIGASVSTMERIRKDLSIPSPYRYTVSVKSETQKEKDKYKRMVYDAEKSGKITEDTKGQLYTKINSGLGADLKQEVMSIGPTSKTSGKKNSSRGGAEPLAAAPATIQTRVYDIPRNRQMTNISDQAEPSQQTEKYSALPSYMPPRPSIEELIKNVH